MSDIRIENSRYVVFVLQYENKTALIMSNPPEGWADDDLKIVRNTKYHGITTQFTNGLKFIGDEKDYIESAYSLGGLNANLYLIKYTLRKNAQYKEFLGYSDLSENIAWEERYRGLADFKTKSVKDNKLEINFNSDELEEIIKSYESDEFELNRKYSLDSGQVYNDEGEGDLTPFHQQRMFIQGRRLVGVGEAENEMNTFSGQMNDDDYYFAIPTNFITKGFDRHVEVTNFKSDPNDSLSSQALFCYNDAIGETYAKSGVKFELDVHNFFIVEGTDYYVYGYEGYFVLQRYVFNGSGYDKIQNSDGTYGFKFNFGNGFDLRYPISFSGELEIPMGLTNKEAYSIEFRMEDTNGGGSLLSGHVTWTCPTGGYRIKLTETSLFEDTTSSYDFSHVNDIGSRLLQIMTGKTHKFYSKFLGRNKSGHPPPSTGVPPLYQDYDYVETGEGGELAVIHGFSVRKFKETDALYKSITTSFKDYMGMLMSQHNLALGVENSRYGQRARVEKLEYFYRNETAVKLTKQATNITRKVDPSMFYSGADFGSEKGGDYEHGLGLDEPNVQTSYSIPLKKTSKKYNKTNKYRSDDVGLELTRRKTINLDPTEDTSGDNHIWLLDLKGADPVENYIYSQLHWSDVLAEEPTGITDPDTYRSWRFTPKRSLLRHGWVIRAGLEQEVNMDKRISVASTNANINLATRYIGEDLVVSEKDAIFVNQLERSRVLPEIIKFTYPIDDDVMDMILGKTTVEIGGENEDVPNFYFKLQFINESGETESGYIKSVSPNNNQIELIKANEKIMFSGIDGRTPDDDLIKADTTTITSDTTTKTADNG